MRKLFPIHFLILLCLAMAFSSVASEISPFIFEGVSDQNQYDEWQRLIKYKLWGTGSMNDGIGVQFSNNKVFISDSAGYSGSAKGSLSFSNEAHSIGGPLVFGGGFSSGTGDDSILNGPSHFGGQIVFSDNARDNKNIAWKGLICAEGGFNDNASYIKRNDCGNSEIPEIDATLDVPLVDWDYQNFSLRHEGNWAFINPEESIVIPDDSDDFYDILVTGDLKLGDLNTYLYIDNPRGRMVRIFVHGRIEIASTLHNVLVRGSNGIVDNADYAGNLLFYSPNSIKFPSQRCLFQGTYISGGEISFEDHYRFAGQLLAKRVQIHHDFDASNFRYVPFNPPKLSVTGDVLEDNAVKGDTLLITLSKIPPTKVTFDYCFEVKASTECVGNVDNPSYCEYANVDDIQNVNFPICGDTLFHAYFNKGDSVLATPIVVHAVDDNLEEEMEDFKLVISNLSAAVYMDGGRETDGGYRNLVSIIDNDAAPLSKDTTVVAKVYERLAITKFPAMLADGVTPLVGYTVYIESVPAKGTLTYNGSTVKVGDSFDANPSTGFVDGLTFQPSGGEFGAGYAEIGFTVSRIGNTTVRSSPHTMTIDVVNLLFEIEENSIVGTTVGVVDNLSVTEGCAITYGNVGGAFDIGVGSEIVVNGKLDYETISTYSVIVKCNDGPSVDSSVVSVIILDVNEPPAVRDTVLRVAENEPTGTVVGTIPVYDEDGNPEFLQNRLSIIDGPKDKYAIDSLTGVITTKVVLDYEEKMFDTLLVLVKDQEGNRDSAYVIIAIGDVNESSTIIVTEVEVPKSDTSWTFPKDTIFVNRTEIVLSWDADGKPQPDTTIKNMHEGFNPVTLKYFDKTKNNGVEKTVYIFVCTRTPQVDIAATVVQKPVDNIYTIVETVSESDTAYYINKEKNDIRVTIREPILDETYTEKNCQYKTTDKTINVAFDTLAVDSSVFKTMHSIMKEGVILDLSPKSKVSSANANDSLDLHTYKTTVKGQNVTISYYTNSKGDVVKNKSGVEVMKVSYEAVSKTGSKIIVSYEADAMTGEVIKQWEGAEFMVSYPYKSDGGQAMEVSYFTNTSGKVVKNEEGNTGYSVRFTYTDAIFGNTCSRSIIVVVDMIVPVVEILSPSDRSKIHANFVEVIWTVDGNQQDSLKMQGLLDKTESITRIYRDKAGNESSAYVIVNVKKPKDVSIDVEKNVTIVDRDLVEEYYADNVPDKGESYAISMWNHSKGKEEEIFVGGKFKMKSGSGDEPYPGLEGHLGPTLTVDVKLPMVTAVGGLATFDDIMIGSQVSLDGVDAKDSKKMSTTQFVSEHCLDEFKLDDYTRNNLYDTKISVHIWIYTNLGQYVDDYSYKIDLNNPDYVSKAGMLNMFFELKPDVNGYVRTKNGRMLATGAYVYKTEVFMKSRLLCDMPPIKDVGMPAANVRGSIRKVSDDMLRSFGYKRPTDN